MTMKLVAKTVKTQFPFFCIDEFNPPHKTQWKSKLSLSQ